MEHVYSDKENVNTLTALLAAHGIRHAVVCPGSRNAPIVHNLNEAPDIACHPVTDERSAGFYALGMALALDEPVAVCVTSGTALLNLMPAVAEAFHQHVPVVVISADRPQAWIGQLDGQTLPQADALGRFVGRAVSLPEPHDDEERWFCNRLVNEALIVARRRQPVHINVPISEPLFRFSCHRLPDERCIRFVEPHADSVDDALLRDYCRARRPMVVVGQYHQPDGPFCAALSRLGRRCVVLHEALAHPQGGVCIDEALLSIPPGDEDSYAPDFLLYLGDTVVSKRLRRFLRGCRITGGAWEVTEDGCLHDTFQCVSGVVSGPARDVLEALSRLPDDGSGHDVAPAEPDYLRRWGSALQAAAALRDAFMPDYSQMAAVKAFEALLGGDGGEWAVHYANSSAVRLADIYARHYVFCNRGVNGIEGSLSAAAGFSLVVGRRVFCVVGDLSFFYDQNALWQQQLRGNLRILLLNNGGGGIFRQLQGLGLSPACDRLVAARHSTTAEGICRQNGVGYMSVSDAAQLQPSLVRLIGDASDRPLLLEVFTDPAEDARVQQSYWALFAAAAGQS